MADKSRELFLIGEYCRAVDASPSHAGIGQPDYCNLGFSPHCISGGGFLAQQPMSKRHPEEAYDFGELDTFARHAATTILVKDKNPPQNKKTTLNILTAASAILDISTKHSPQTTSTSAVSNHTPSSKSGPTGFQSQFQSPSTANQSWGTTMTANHQTATSYNMEDELKGFESKRLHGTPLSKSEQILGKNPDPKTLRRLAQNREAARKSRLRKKAYVQQLEASRIKLSQMEQELIRARQQGMLSCGTLYGDMSSAASGFSGPHTTGAAAFNLEYAHWMDEKNSRMGDLRTALRANLNDNDLHMLVENIMSHYDEIFQIKSVAVKADVFHLLSGMWKTPAERCFLWMGGFRPSDILKVLLPQIEPLTEQQIMGIYNLQQSSQQAEDALSQGLDTLQQSLAETLAWGPLESPDSTMSTYLNQMAMALGKLGTLESFIRQADHLRQQTMKQMQRLLTVQQMARGLLAMGEYFNRLRALSSLWSARPKD
ncbi:hypothetical protein GOP47_0005316 [Adiantum capillus-veneris]|uniref:Uncharacterized protein n=1 Tax=Adiantum capillus-veneris TaxID=13818 RepID=A0A9D4ZN46_ADICA|nr:hypothetical protein GOP47_0005316 [Adiantum capillus-veneris]